MVPLQEILDQKRERPVAESGASEVIPPSEDILCLVPLGNGFLDICLLGCVRLLLVLCTSHIALHG